MPYLYQVKRNQSLLIIGKVWPEPNSSAAGTRMMQLIAFYKSQGYKITFVSTAKTSEFQVDLNAINIETSTIELNSGSFDEYIKGLNPNVVIFDRFMTEEQFGWRVIENCPKAIRILNTEDLHFLRRSRYESVKKVGDLSEVELKTDDAIREIASIYRCDLTLLVSKVEMELLKSEFQIPESILFHLPVFPNDVIKNAPTFNEREGFLFIGNFYHEPNWDALRFLKQTVWPLIRRKLPSAELNVYGAYPSQKVYDFHNSKEGFLIHGRAENAIEVTLENRVSLAPLRFGAGIKGKLLEAMVAGTPSITTSIGAEGMASPDEWPGSVVDDPDLFAEAACSVYTDEVLWNQSQLKGYTVLENHFESDGFFKRFEMKLSAMESRLDEFRSAYFIQQLVKHQSIMSNRYLSKWIEQKNKA